MSNLGRRKKHGKKQSKKRQIFRGGVKKINTAISSFEAVLEMIRTPGAILKCIAHGSKSGYIFRLDIPHDPNLAQFMALNDEKTALTKPVYTLVVKFAILSQTGNDRLQEMNVGGKLYEKETETFQDFFNEAFNQQNIYTSTLSPSGNPVTMSVVDFSHFNSTKGIELINVLKLLVRDPISIQILDYIEGSLNNNANLSLGMIFMEMANYGFIELADVDNSEARSQDINYALAQIFTLFTKLKLFNYDCHTRNILAKPDRPNPDTNQTEELSKLLDFGRVVNVSETTLSGIPQRYIAKIIDLYNKVSRSNYEIDRIKVAGYKTTDLFIVESDRGTNAPEVIDTMEDILKFMANLDYAINCALFNFENWDQPQMTGMLKHLYGTSFNVTWGGKKSTIDAFNVLMNSTNLKKIQELLYNYDITKPDSLYFLEESEINDLLELLTYQEKLTFLENMAWIPGTNPPGWTRIKDTVVKYKQIADFIRKINTDPQQRRNLVSPKAIHGMIVSGEIYSLEPSTDYDKSGVVLIPPPGELEVVRASIYDPHRTYRPVYNDDSDHDTMDDDTMDHDMIVERGGRVKKSRNYRKSKKSKKSKKSRKSKKSKKSKKSRK